jgi:predicted MFS family arabinose efflux permease
MIRYFLVMAVTGTSLLVANFVLGFFATAEPHGPHAIARAIHLLFSLVTVVTLLGIHSIVYTYFIATGKWAKEVVEAYQLPDWISTQAKKNKRRAFRFIMGSMTAIAIAAWLGAAADTRGSGYAIWHLGSAAFALAYNIGSFAVEYAVIVAHVRLLTELKDRADKLREERYGPELAHAGEPEQHSSGLATESRAPLP